MRFILRLFGWAFAAGTILFVIGVAGAAGVIWHYSKDLPDSAQLRNYEPPVMSRVHAGDGSLIAEFARERRLYLPIQAVPKLIIDAFLSAEDKNFYKHFGVDPEGLARAAISNFRNRGSGRRPQGASTITQQVAKNFLVGSEQSIERKIREALIALRIESTYSKDKILELYLNEIYLGAPAPGQGSYGVAAAALNYFGKSVHELNAQEAAYLAALPKAPTDLHPFRNRERAIERRNYVLDRMAENGFLKRADADAAKKQPLGVNPRTVSPNQIAAGYFAEEIRRELQDRYGEKKLLEGGLSVRATVDPKMQLMARKALVDGLVRFDEARGWRGAIQKIDAASREWGLAIAELPVLGDVKPWRLAVVLAGIFQGRDDERPLQLSEVGDHQPPGAGRLVEEALAHLGVGGGVAKDARARHRDRADARPGQQLAPASGAVAVGGVDGLGVQADGPGPQARDADEGRGRRPVADLQQDVLAGLGGHVWISSISRSPPPGGVGAGGGGGARGSGRFGHRPRADDAQGGLAVGAREDVGIGHAQVHQTPRDQRRPGVVQGRADGGDQGPRLLRTAEAAGAGQGQQVLDRVVLAGGPGFRPGDDDAGIGRQARTRGVDALAGHGGDGGRGLQHHDDGVDQGLVAHSRAFR